MGIRKRIIFSFSVFVLIWNFFFIWQGYSDYASAASYVYVDNADGANLRSGPSTGDDILAIADGGARLTFLSEEKNDAGEVWYKVEFSGEICYVRSDLVSDITEGANDSSDDHSQVTGQIGDFPGTYSPYISTLSSQHPSWSFIAEYTGLDWEAAVYREAHPVSRNLVPSTYPDAYKSKAAAAYDADSGEYIIFDSRDWVAASEAAIRFYMDPRNGLSEAAVFQFLSNKYDESTQNIDSLNYILSGTFLAEPFPEDGYSSYAELLLEAGRESGVNPLTLASMVLVEQGYDGSSDSVNGSTGYYNFFNINAFASIGTNAVANGLSHAKNQGWDTRVKSIKEGANWFARNYVSQNQYTLYLKKFNIMNGLDLVGTGQYMTNIRGAKSEGEALSEGYLNFSDLPLTFIIPIYNNMPSDPAPEPTLAPASEVSSDTSSSDDTKSGADSGSSKSNSEDAVGIPKTDVHELSELVGPILPGTEFADFADSFTLNGGGIRVYDSTGNEISSGALATGMELTLFDSNNKDVYSGIIAVKGDNNGDGKVNSADALRAQRYSVGAIDLSPAQIAASDINGDGKVNSADALLIQRYSVGTYDIKLS